MSAVVEFWQQLCPHKRYAILGVAGVSICLVVRRLFKKDPKKLHVPDHQRDKIYLFQFPSCITCPTMSPFALKLETWIRWQKLPYMSIRAPSRWSKHGQIPFIELNGEQIADSNIVIKELQKKFDRQDDLTVEQRCTARGFQVMLENQTAWSYLYYRFVEKMGPFLKYSPYVAGIKKFIVILLGPGIMRKRLNKHGIGRHTTNQVYQFGMDDLQALSDYLGDKKYMFGDKMSTLDCYVFAHVCQIISYDIGYPHLSYLRRNCKNLEPYILRIKEKIWPDWDQVCADHLYDNDK